MRELPILFQAPMIRATVAGTKTQTRRAIKLQTGQTFDEHALKGAIQEWRPVFDKVAQATVGRRAAVIRCPYGQPGDRLWCRETFYAFGRWETRFSQKKRRDEWHFIDMTLECGKEYSYAATDAHPLPLRGRRDAGITPGWWKRPAIYMPRVASRITLEITDVRVERLQDISEADALAEGIEAMRCPDCHLAAFGLSGWGHDQLNPTAAAAYRYLWESINGEGSWDANPWVWAISFKHAALNQPTGSKT